MTQRFKSVMILPASCDRVFELLTSPEALRACGVHLGAKIVRAQRREEGEGVIVEVYNEKQGQTGHGEDKSTRTTTWNVDRRRGSWVHVQHGMEKRARAEGTVRLQEQDEGCRYTVEGEIQIKVPIVGKMIEKKVVEALEKEAEREEGYWKRVLLGK